MQDIHWGMIGAGDVTEVKSGPAFQKVDGSKLVAIMRRNAENAEDYAKRHGVAKWYTNAQELIDDPGVNAIYIATPPDSHEDYALRALKAGKPVYVEKPMTLSSIQAQNMAKAVIDNEGKLTVAHYRREQPYFKKIKALLEENAIGIPKMASLSYWKQPLSQQALSETKTQWRLDPNISGGGLFHDIAPHQLDLMYYFFGEIDKAQGIAHNQTKFYPVDDVVAGQVLFLNEVLFNGTWLFNASESRDACEIIGSEGKITFSVFNNDPIELVNHQGKQIITFEKLEHVQQPMIAAVVSYFQGKRGNPCSASEGYEIMKVMDAFTQ
jgi:predicted dehydrogenase